MKKISAAIAIIFLLFIFTVNVAAYEPYTNYTYSQDTGNPQTEPQAYVPERVVTGEDLGISSLYNPEDIYVSDTNDVYIADSGNNRVIKLDENFNVTKIYSDFINDGSTDTFNDPEGIFVDDQDSLYICDTENSRIVKLAQDGSMIQIYETPETTLLSQEDFKPSKLVVDFSGRMFVVSKTENKGIIALNKDGSFSCFFGAVETSSSYLDFFKSIATDAQRDTMTQNVPVTYSNVDIDDENTHDFVYACVSMVDVSNVLNDSIYVRLLNPLGTDILKRNGFFSIIGDVDYIVDDDDYQISNFCDIAYIGDGMYSVLGNRFGRVFTYDASGNLLYIFGAKGNSLGQFFNPVAIDMLEDNYLVLDRNYNQFTIFKPTEYGLLLQQATELYSQREYEEAEQKYDEILKYTARSGVAYLGKANCRYQAGDYKAAMKYYKLCNKKDLYAEAFSYYRDELISRYFGRVATAIVICAAALIIFTIIRRLRRKKSRV